MAQFEKMLMNGTCSTILCAPSSNRLPHRRLKGGFIVKMLKCKRFSELRHHKNVALESTDFDTVSFRMITVRTIRTETKLYYDAQFSTECLRIGPIWHL